MHYFNVFQIIMSKIMFTFKHFVIRFDINNENNAKRQGKRKQSETLNSKTLKLWTSRQALKMCLP